MSFFPFAKYFMYIFGHVLTFGPHLLPRVYLYFLSTPEGSVYPYTPVIMII